MPSFIAGAYLKVIAEDYKMVAIETAQDMKARPVKSSIILGILGSVGYLIATNPDETSYREHIISCSNDLLQLSDLIRNPSSDKHIHDIMWAYNQGRVRRFTLGVCSFMWIDHYSKDADIYEAKCKHLKVGWTEFHKYIVDVGVNGRWLNLEKAMIDYDINPNEWKDVAASDK